MARTATNEKKQPAVRRGRPPNSSARASRDRLMRAAAVQFSQAEFSEVNMEDIAAEAGMTGAAIYNHFPSKDALFIATANHMTQINLVALKRAIESGPTWRSGFAAVLALFVDDTTGWLRYPLLTSAVQLKMLQNREKFDEMLGLRREYVAQFEGLVSRAVAEGDLPADVSTNVAAELLMGFVFNGMGAVMSHMRSEREIRQIVDTASLLLTGSVEPALPNKLDR